MKYEYQGSGFEGTPDYGLSKEQQKQIFFDSLRIRRIEEAIEARYHEDELKTPIHLVIGQEATYVGSCAALRKEDYIYASHRTHGAYLAKGGDLQAMLAEFFCRKSGCSGSRGGSMHLIDQSVGMMGSSAICGGNVPITTGMALTAQLMGHDRANLCYFGDGASEEGAVWESLNFAALKKLPVIYFCENNFFSVFTPLDKRQPENTELWKKAEAFGVQAELVDGTNPLKVYDVTKRAVERARAGEGPSFIEARVYRWRGHGGAGDDNNKGYRDPEELKQWSKFCPVEGYYAYLKAKNIISDSERQEMETKIKDEFAECFEAARNSPDPEEADLYTHVYKEYQEKR